ncbi:Pepsin A [Leucoagaricus sp. SymC.cos]|nr:Pepsin A [Leucoagaricus sp. SymC.cos]
MPSWKGKQKALARADDGGGTTAGVVIPLELSGSGIYDVAYTVPVSIGYGDQKFSLEVDTGSSDLWVASTSCSSSACGHTGGSNYDPSTSGKETGLYFSINYLSGSVSGPVYWDRVTVGGYSIENQALAAASSVTDEDLAPDFSGILGLALPLNSIIAENIPPVTNNSPDGAAWASNLFSITPTSNAPSSRFLSLSLSRPGSDRIPSYLGIGKHPPDLVNDPSQIHYSTVVSNTAGSLFWKASVRDITVWVDGQPRPVDIGRSNTGAVFPSAVIDSGVPYIFTTSKVANAIYGALDVHPASDGNYYVPCKTPLNMTISLDDRPALSLHPLDVTAEPPKDNNADFCIGLIQAADGQLSNPNSHIGDIILGVPFMRNVYTVMA